MSIIVQPGGRFGNFFVKICNALVIADETKAAKLVLPQHPMLVSTVFNLPLNHYVGDADAIIVNDVDMFSVREIRRKIAAAINYDFSLRNTRRLARKHDLIRLFTFATKYDDYARINPLRSLVFYMRAGDIFHRKHVHSGYVQYPRYFVEQVLRLTGNSIDECKDIEYGQATVVAQCEDLSNPVAKWWSSSRLPHNDPNSDICDAICANMHTKALAIGVGTFAYVAIVLSPVMECIYTPDYFPLSATEQDKVVINLPGFIRPGQWTCSADQLREMLEYEPADSQ